MANGRTRIATAAALVAAFALVGTVSGAPSPSKTASAALAVQAGVDGRCHAVSTSSWTGFPVWAVEIRYRADGSTLDGWHDIVYPKTHNGGTVVRDVPVVARPTSMWTARVAFVSRSGTHLAVVDATPATAPANCAYP